MDGLQNWVKIELERQQVSTIDEAIIKAKALTDFRHGKYDKDHETMSSHAISWGDYGKSKEQLAHPKDHITKKSEGKAFGHQNYAKRKALTTKGNGCYIWVGRMAMQSALN